MHMKNFHFRVHTWHIVIPTAYPRLSPHADSQFPHLSVSPFTLHQLSGFHRSSHIISQFLLRHIHSFTPQVSTLWFSSVICNHYSATFTSTNHAVKLYFLVTIFAVFLTQFSRITWWIFSILPRKCVCFFVTPLCGFWPLWHQDILPEVSQ